MPPGAASVVPFNGSSLIEAIDRSICKSIIGMDKLRFEADCCARVDRMFDRRFDCLPCDVQLDSFGFESCVMDNDFAGGNRCAFAGTVCWFRLKGFFRSCLEYILRGSEILIGIH